MWSSSLKYIGFIYEKGPSAVYAEGPSRFFKTMLKVLLLSVEDRLQDRSNPTVEGLTLN